MLSHIENNVLRTYTVILDMHNQKRMVARLASHIGKHAGVLHHWNAWSGARFYFANTITLIDLVQPTDKGATRSILE